MSRIVRLGDIAKIYSGGTPSRSNPAYWGGDIPWVKTTQIQNCHISEDDIAEWITKEGMKNSSAKPAPRGSILMAMIGQGKTRGQVAILDVDATTNQNAAAIQLDSQHDRDYVFQQLLFRYKHIRNVSNASGQQNLNLEIIRSITFPSPPLPEQTAIADLLSTWDEAIEKTERLIQAKERRFQWLLRRTMTDTAKGIVKEGWKRIAIGSLLTESRIPDMTNDPHKRLTVRLHLRGVEAREVRGTEASDATAYFVRKADQLIYGKQNIFKGAVGIVPPELDGYASTQDIPAFDIDKTVDPGWLLFLFSCPGFYKKLEIYASGSGSKRLHPKDLFKISVSVPSLEEQKSFAERLYIARKEINLLEQLAERYKTQKRGLMQKLLTGQWRIKFEKEVA